jgi:MraZ protein
MASYIGRHLNKVDRKGRVSVPARFRSAIASATGQAAAAVVLSPVHDLRAIDGCDLARIDEFVARLDTPGAYSEEEKRIADVILSQSEELAVDGDGRIMLPAALIELAGVTEQALFVGVGRTFQIWNPERRAAFEAETLEAAGGSALSLKDLSTLGAGGGAR